MQTFQASYCNRNGLQFDAAGRRLMVVGWRPTLFDTLGSDPPLTPAPADGDSAAHFRLACGGTALAFTSGYRIRVWDFAAGRERWDETEIETGARNISDLAVSSDGATVFATYPTQDTGYDWRTRLLAFDATTGATKGTFPLAAGAYTWLSVSADGRRLTGRGSYDAAVWDLTRPDDPSATATVLNIGGLGHYVDGVAPSADGTKLAIVTGRGVQLWDVTGEKPAQVFRSGKHKRRVSAVACSPTRPLVATGDTAGQIFLWDHTGGVLTRYDWGLGEVVALCFAPDGLRCAGADDRGKVVVWDVDA